MRLADYSKGPNGLFTLNVFRRGILIEHFEEENLVVDASKFANSRLIGGSVSGNSVTQFAVGTNGTAPAAGNTALTNVYKNAINTVSYPDASSALFAFSLGTSEANGLSIMEFGLMTGANNLYARKVRPVALLKDVDITLSGTWLITF